MGRDRFRRDSAGIGPDPSMAGRLSRLSDMRGFKVADGEPDILGWEVRTLAGVEVGKIDDLYVDPHRGEVVLIDVDLKDSDQHVNVPIRGVQLDRTRRVVVIDSGDLRAARETGFGYEEDRDRAQERVDEEEASDERNRLAADNIDTMDEVVVERRPVIEEVVVRRRVVDSDDASRTD